MHQEGTTKQARARAKKVRKRDQSTPPPATMRECIGGDVVVVPFLGRVCVAFFLSGSAMVRLWGPPTRDRTRRVQLYEIALWCPVACLPCEECWRHKGECPACADTGIVGLYY